MKTNAPILYGKQKAPEGKTPAIALIRPKYPYNVGAAVRAASCFGVKQVWFTGDRVKLNPKERLPREERMKGYKDVELRQYEYVFDQFPNATPIAIELKPNAEFLPHFEHPENALYVFGPEDGSLEGKHLQHCHRVGITRTRHCVNLSAAVYIVLYDRYLKRLRDGLETPPVSFDCLNEPRGFSSEPLEFAQELVQ